MIMGDFSFLFYILLFCVNYFLLPRKNSSHLKKYKNKNQQTNWEHVFELRECTGVYLAEEEVKVIFKCSRAGDHIAGYVDYLSKIILNVCQD